MRCRCPSQYGTLRTVYSLNNMKFAHRTVSKLSLRIHDHVCKAFYVKKDARQMSPLVRKQTPYSVCRYSLHPLKRTNRVQ